MPLKIILEGVNVTQQRLQTHDTSKTHASKLCISRLLEFACHLIMSHAWKHICHKPHLRPESKVNTLCSLLRRWVSLCVPNFSPDVSYSTQAWENKTLKAEEGKLSRYASRKSASSNFSCVLLPNQMSLLLGSVPLFSSQRFQLRFHLLSSTIQCNEHCG